MGSTLRVIKQTVNNSQLQSSYDVTSGPLSQIPVDSAPNRAIPKLTPYDGTSDFQACIMKFEVIAECCHWNENTKLLLDLIFF